MSADQQTPKADAVPVAEAAAVVDEFPHKVFVGNIAFTTTEEQLREFFSPAGTV